MLLMTLVGMSAEAQQRNVLQLPDVTTQIGNVQLPVSIENTDEIVGAQFDLTLPDGVTAETTGVLANRSDGHTVTVSRLNSGAYRVLLHSAQNRPLRGQSGVVMYLPVNIPDFFEEGSEHPLAVVNAVLGKATGENVLTEAIAGSIRISKLPDLTVKNITCDKQTVNPGDRITCSWQVENIGELATDGGWSEQVSLVTEDGSQNKLIATTNYDGILDASGIVSRQVEITLPTLLGIDGQARLQVRIVPDSKTGESTSAQGNNTQTGSSLININKVLTLEISPNRVDENASRRIALRVNRSGRWTAAETFAITATMDSRVSVPSSVTIPANQSGAVVYFNVTDNDVLDNDSIVNISAEGNGYAAVICHLLIEDNEQPDLMLRASKSYITEGETFQLTITRSVALAQPVTITLTSENAKRFSFPAVVTIPAGETSATVDVTAVDDEVPSLELPNAFTASAPRYNKGEVIVLLKDNDMPVLTLELTPNQVQESVGVVAVAGVLRRTTNTNSKITVRLSDDSNGGLYFGNPQLVLDKGVEEVHFNFGPVDNAQMDGDRTYTITAAVWLSSCSCSAAGEKAGAVTAHLRVLDDDGPALGITSSLSTLKEGGKTALTLSRNTTDNSSPLTVILSSDYEEGLTYDHSVTIPAGQTSATIEVNSQANDVQGDNHTVIFTIEAEGYAKGTCYLMVTDQTLPDARICDISFNNAEVLAGSEVEISIEVSNEGQSSLPEATPIRLYLNGNETCVASLYTSSEVEPGQKQILTKTITLPQTVGVLRYHAVINENRRVAELLYTNNESKKVSVLSQSPYTVALTTDKNIYRQGDTIHVSGNIFGNNISETCFDLFLINGKSRQVNKVTTDEHGVFSFDWPLYNLQCGHFTMGGCFPDEDKWDGTTSFDVYGLKKADNGYTTCDVTLGDTYTGFIEIVNPTALELTNVQAEIIVSPDNCTASVDIPSVIGANEIVRLNYSLTGTAASTERKWDEVTLRITSAETATLDAILYFYCRNALPQVVCNIQNLNTTVTKGTTRDYELRLTNIGRGETGDIMLSLPPFISSKSGKRLTSLSANDTTVVALNISTTEQMQLNVPVTGTIGINCENGSGTIVNFSVEAVSEEKGKLIIDVCDEYTYNTPEKPHVSDANVTIKHPYSGEILAEGKTGTDGKYAFDLQEGYYKVEVTANKHESYTNYCNVNPGKSETLLVNLSYQPIIVQWSVEETEVTDEYEIVTTVKYETNVPMPVVKITIPERIDGDNMAVGDATMIDMTLTNVGLVRADNVEALFPKNMTEWIFEPLVQTDYFSLLPQQAVTIPIRITRIADESRINARRKNFAEDMVDNYGNCMAGLGARYEYLCGDELKNNAAAERMAMKLCAVSATMQAIGDALSNIFGGGPGSPGGNAGGGGGGGYNYNEVTKTLDICDPCDAARMENMINAGLGFTWFGHINDALDDAIEAAQEERNTGKYPDGGWYIKKIGERVFDATTGALLESKLFERSSDFWSLGDGIYKVVSACDDLNSNARSTEKRNIVSRSWVDEFNAVALDYMRQLELMDSLLLYAYGDPIWYKEPDEQKAAFVKFVCGLPEGIVPSDEELMVYKPESVTTEQMYAYLNYVNGTGNSLPSVERIEATLDEFDKINTAASEKGFSSMTEEYFSSYDSYRKHYDDLASNSVCATITLQFKQTMTMTRQAFRGTLFVFNGHDNTPMTDVKLNLEVKNSYGQLSTTHEFQIHAESLNGFTGGLNLDSGWTLGAQQTGTATVLFIPTKYAAPKEPEEWSFGGTLTYIDPFTGLEVTRDLYPVTLTVKPSPELDLTYFMQRDVYGDDPLTEVVEPMVPAEFALVINNKGNGDANNVRMVTQQPEIIENEKGLLVNFELVNSQVNGGDAALSFGQSIANDFGTIPAHSQMYAQWWLQSSLLGHFTDYDVQATHVTSYGNEDLSLLDEVTIHELIHGFTVRSDGDMPVRGFLVNDIVDADDLPDEVYFTDATQQGAYIATNANMVKLSDTEFVLNVNAGGPGWNYGSLLDPTYGKQKLVKVTRADGTEVNADNIWQTDRTLRDGKDPLYENRLHFVGNMSADGETFYLTFEPKPELELEVESYAGVPEEGTVLKEQLTELTVKFNKSIKAESFTTEDITVNCQGVAQDASQIVIEQVNESEFKLVLNEVTLLDGYYVLNVQTAGIEDNEGFSGTTGKQATWIQFVDGKVALKLTASPADGGTISPASGRFDYDSDVMLKATAAEGYDFTGWTLGGEVLSTESEFSYHLIADAELKALFNIKHFNVNIDYETTRGTIEGSATGIYDYGTQLEFTAIPTNGYVFDAWMVNDEIISKSSLYTVVVDRNIDIEALFVEDVIVGLEAIGSDALQVNIAPIPLREYMYITGNFNKIRQVDIYDMQGIKNITSNNAQQGIYVGQLRAGIYYVLVSTDKGGYRAKVLKR